MVQRIENPAEGIRFVQGNSLNETDLHEGLEDLPQVQLILTDPPYNIADKGKVTKAHGKLWSNAEAWGEHFNDAMTEEQYEDFLIRFLITSWNLLEPGGSLVTFMDRAYAGRVIPMAENIINHAVDWKTAGPRTRCDTKCYESHKKQPSGFVFKNQMMFFKTNSVPKIRTTNYGSAYEVALWFVKPLNWKQAKPNVFNYKPPIKNLRLYPTESWDSGKLVKKHGKLNVAEYHNTCSSNVFLYSIGSKTVGHPCEKYTAMLRPLVEHHSDAGGLILDPFAGGFNLAMVAKELGRQFVGFDLSEEWFDKGLAAFEKKQAEKVKI
ncbi:site-specific DNA-methyltransferase [Candidatus Pacearchaeota archaeon]|nr:site-specific DNA-methyltransferase [Candidatus Pacearchaeota archaeon]